MFCYQCGCHLSEQDYCTSCGADVSMYKKIMAVSNLFYNEGLEKAGVRDLSGAISSLRQSLKFNKNNIEARNLLGLVYFELGEVVAALSEWVISQNIRGEKNLANEYIKMVQSNATRLDTMNQTIKKYNQAYTYCVNESKDLAIIQLKRVLGLNPKYIKAHQLLALLYIDCGEYEKAKRELNRCLRVDCNNTLCLRYLKEVDRMLLGDDLDGKQTGGAKGKEDALRYQSDNEVIIQPLHEKETKSSPISTIFNIIIGIIIGAAAVYFLMVPGVKQDAQNQLQNQVTEYGNKLDAKTSEIQTLNAQILALQGERDDLNRQIMGYEGEEGTLSTIDNLLGAAHIYLETQDVHETAAKLEQIVQNADVEKTSEEFRDLYGYLFAAVGPELSGEYMEEGYSFYRSEDFGKAAESLEKAVYYDAQNDEALYHLANTYRKMEEEDKARETFEKLVELFPESDWVRRAQGNLDNLNTEE